MINIIIADNQVLTRTGIITLLAEIIDITVLDYANTANELEQQIIKLTPDVVLIDHSFNNRFSIHDVKRIYIKYPAISILVLANRQSKSKVLEVINLGIKNYVFKECSREELVHAIYNTAKGEQFFCKNTFETLFGNKLIPDKPAAFPQLSSRELQIIHLIADGHTNGEIAEKLFLSVHTIKTHRKNMIKKLGFSFKNTGEFSAFIQKHSAI